VDSLSKTKALNRYKFIVKDKDKVRVKVKAKAKAIKNTIRQKVQ